MSRFRLHWHVGALAICVLSAAVGCGIDDLKVKSFADGGKSGRSARGGESGASEEQGGRGNAGREAGKGGGDAASGGSGGAAGKSGSGGRAGSSGSGKAGSGGTGGGGAGGTGGAAGAAANGGELLNALSQLVEQDCGKFAQCAPFFFNGQFADMAACRARRMLMYNFVAALPGIQWTPQNVSECKAVVAAQSCRQYIDDDGQMQCLVAGTRANGMACNVRDQCASRFCATSGYSCGTCAPAPAEGASCTLDVDCPDHTWCGCADGGNSCAQTICVRPRNDGEACSNGTPCGYGLNCLGDGRCHTQPNQENASCIVDNGVNCDLTQGLICSNSQCLKLVAADTCSATTYCRMQNSICQAATGACTAPPTDGGPCADGDSCAFPALCVDGKCQAPGAALACQ